MASKAFLIALAIAYVEARFGNENVPSGAIQALDGQFGQPGQASTLAGQVPGTLLAAADACAHLELADEIVATLGDDPAVIDAAKGLVVAEMNFNPSAVSVNNFCSDASLPATEALRGIVPLTDPAVDGSDLQNANAQASLTNPFPADGLSVADISRQQGFTNFNEQDAEGNLGTLAVAPGADAAASADAASADAASADTAAADAAAVSADECVVVNEDEADAAEADAAATGDAATADAAANDAAAADVGALAFGNCDLTVSRVANTEIDSRNNANNAGRFFFVPNDAGIAAKQQEALNGNIVTNAICNEIVNSCGGNAAARDACAAQQADIAAQFNGAPDNNSQDLADAFNAAVASIGA